MLTSPVYVITDAPMRSIIADFDQEEREIGGRIEPPSYMGETNLAEIVTIDQAELGGRELLADRPAHDLDGEYDTFTITGFGRYTDYTDSAVHEMKILPAGETDISRVGIPAGDGTQVEIDDDLDDHDVFDSPIYPEDWPSHPIDIYNVDGSQSELWQDTEARQTLGLDRDISSDELLSEVDSFESTKPEQAAQFGRDLEDLRESLQAELIGTLGWSSTEQDRTTTDGKGDNTFFNEYLDSVANGKINQSDTVFAESIIVDNPESRSKASELQDAKADEKTPEDAKADEKIPKKEVEQASKEPGVEEEAATVVDSATDTDAGGEAERSNDTDEQGATRSPFDAVNATVESDIAGTTDGFAIHSNPETTEGPGESQPDTTEPAEDLDEINRQMYVALRDGYNAAQNYEQVRQQLAQAEAAGNVEEAALLQQNLSDATRLVHMADAQLRDQLTVALAANANAQVMQFPAIAGVENMIVGADSAEKPQFEVVHEDGGFAGRAVDSEILRISEPGRATLHVAEMTDAELVNLATEAAAQRLTEAHEGVAYLTGNFVGVGGTDTIGNDIPMPADGLTGNYPAQVPAMAGDAPFELADLGAYGQRIAAGSASNDPSVPDTIVNEPDNLNQNGPLPDGGQTVYTNDPDAQRSRGGRQIEHDVMTQQRAIEQSATGGPQRVLRSVFEAVTGLKVFVVETSVKTSFGRSMFQIHVQRRDGSSFHFMDYGARNHAHAEHLGMFHAILLRSHNGKQDSGEE